MRWYQQGARRGSRDLGEVQAADGREGGDGPPADDRACLHRARDRGVRVEGRVRLDGQDPQQDEDHHEADPDDGKDRVEPLDDLDGQLRHRGRRRGTERTPVSVRCGTSTWKP